MDEKRSELKTIAAIMLFVLLLTLCMMATMPRIEAQPPPPPAPTCDPDGIFVCPTVVPLPVFLTATLVCRPYDSSAILFDELHPELELPPFCEIEQVVVSTPAPALPTPIIIPSLIVIPPLGG